MLLSIEALLNNDTSLKQIKQAAAAINDCFYIGPSKIETKTIIAAYALYKIRISDAPFSRDYAALLDNTFDLSRDLRSAISHNISENNWHELSKLLPRFAPDIFGAITLLPLDYTHSIHNTSTPSSITKLAHALLQCQPNDKVADISCNNGSFLLEAAKLSPKTSFFSYSSNVDSTTIAKIRSDIADIDATIELQDPFNIIGSEKGAFDKAFANYPFGLRLRNLGNGLSYIDSFINNNFKISKATSSDWIFNLLLVDIIKEDGKAIGIMGTGCSYIGADTPMRQYFVDHGLIEMVIALPPNIFEHTGISTLLTVFSHNNQSVRLVDATNIYHKARKNNAFTEEDLQVILQACSTDTDISKNVSIEELRNNDYALTLNHYINNEIHFDNGVPFESIIKSITRGAPCTAKELDAIVSKKPTNMQYLLISNINDGKIDEELPYLSEIDTKYEKYCLKNNNIILSKIGYPVKMAVASVQEGQKILASGNLFIIEVDESKVNPVYLQSFFDSETGSAALRTIIQGSAIANLSIDRLKKLQIPLPSLDTQNRIASKYQATVDEIAVLKLKLQKATDRLHHIFDEEEVD